MSVARTEYCVGFVFPRSRDRVLLLRKRRPAWQAGMLNGIGGKVERGEAPAAAMIREFAEEAGLWLEGWQHCATEIGPEYRLDVFGIIDDVAFNTASAVTDEALERVDLDDIHNREDVLSNLVLHISLALDESDIIKPVHLVAGARR